MLFKANSSEQTVATTKAQSSRTWPTWVQLKRNPESPQLLCASLGQKYVSVMTNSFSLEISVGFSKEGDYHDGKQPDQCHEEHARTQADHSQL